MTNKPTGKLAFAHNTISNMEKRIAELEAQLASADVPAANGETYCKNTDAAWAQFCGGVGDGPSAPHPGMIRAFESYYGQSFADKAWRNEASVWAAAWGKAKPEQRLASGQEPVAWMVFWGLGKKRPGALFLDREHAVSHAKQIKSETEVRPVYTHPAPAQQPIANRKEPDMQAICAALGFDPTNHHNAAKCPYCRPAAPAQQPLGIEEIQKLAADNATGGFLGPLTFARAIEAKHGIKGKP